MSGVSAIVIHYDSPRFIDGCLEALKEMPEVGEVIFVDDGSPESPEAQVRAHGATLIRLEKNRGPVVARNAGAAEAAGKYLLFLDVDARPESSYARELAAMLERDARIGVVSGKMVEDGARVWWNFGYDLKLPRSLGAGFFNAAVLMFWKVAPVRKALMRLAEPFTLNFVKDEVRDVDWVIERGFMTRRDLFERLEGLDEEFVMFFEGPDYCRRVRQAGYRVVYTPHAVCDHLGGHSHAGAKRKLLFADARRRYFEKWG